eukprot:gnl/TRDRNA2_/TRDRNA2_172726_c0_seq1.p1 gnl/TRDRNA2_/TRDRNA2_172726_c0~~gnl/TRDRNA2_/TRDRNA2_172726_c0_seq1.p1  ORF type:complete len:155 (-),score=12.83 gnl/TRDRNA2_/TRDRNA2_172726_c0_seq1:35-499(-)
MRRFLAWSLPIVACIRRTYAQPADNPNPVIRDVSSGRPSVSPEWFAPLGYNDHLDPKQVFDMVRGLQDPEHPDLTLEQLGIVDLSKIYVNNRIGTITLQFTPTVPHCSVASLIGLTIKAQLMRLVPKRFGSQIWVLISPGAHCVLEKWRCGIAL